MGVSIPDVPESASSASSSSTSAAFQVGMLFKFFDQWRSITSNRFVLNKVQAHHLQLRSHPPLFCDFWHFNVNAAAAHHPVIQREVDELLAKGAIEPSSGGAGFYSSVFVVPKCTGGLWPILNLKHFNHYMHICFSLRWLMQLFAFGPPIGGPTGIFSFYSKPALFHLGIPTTSGGLGVECLQPSLDLSGKLHVSSSCVSSSNSVQVHGRTCQWSTQTFDSGGTMLDGGSLASHSSQHVGRCSLVVSHSKRSHHGCFGRPGTQGSAISAFNPLAAQWCVLCRQGFSSSVCQVVVGATPSSTPNVYQQYWKEWCAW